MIQIAVTRIQLQGEANEDALNFPGRLDNQIVVLYGNIVGLERKLNTAVTERYLDLKPQLEQLMQRESTTAKTEVAAFNAAATRAGVTPGIVIKQGDPAAMIRQNRVA